MLDQPEIHGRRIAGHRERLGLTQAQLAQRARISVSTLAAIENGRRNPGMHVLVRIAKEIAVDRFGHVRLDLLESRDLTDAEEYRAARFWNPYGPDERSSRTFDDLRPVRVYQHFPGGRDEVGQPVRPLRRTVRPDSGEPR